MTKKIRYKRDIINITNRAIADCSSYALIFIIDRAIYCHAGF